MESAKKSLRKCNGTNEFNNKSLQWSQQFCFSISSTKVDQPKSLRTSVMSSHIDVNELKCDRYNFWMNQVYIDYIVNQSIVAEYDYVLGNSRNSFLV